MAVMVLVLHSWLRWFAILAGLGATVTALSTSASDRSEKSGLLFMIAMDLQLLLGALLYGFLSPYTTGAFQDFGAAMRDPIARFWAVEHLTMMLAAVVFAHLGRILARKAATPAARRTRLLVCFGLSTVLMLAGTPWPGMPAGRPLFRI
ncbi:MAG: hypothetical protein A3H97_02350 [Acidobacteria bacterium RIFCSPLOWO2_02_FULL_65_29]|nr:MAG: hypothetical protein A3H97_02350 [Acidobacteria bacterium RIFCSPLOWO2_02_FULL_65_29]